MAVIANIWMTRDKVLKLAQALESNPDRKGLAFDISMNDEVNQYNQNVSMWVAQSKEDREAKKDRYYVANGAVKWKNEIGAVVAPKKEAAIAGGDESDNLPF